MPASMTDSLQQRERLQNRRAELTQTVARLAAEKDKWTIEDRAEWDAANSEIDRIAAQLPRFGRDDGSVLDGPVNQAMFGGAPHGLDAALNSWLLCQSGRPISGAQARDCEAYGISPQSGTFVARLPSHAPRSAQQWAPQNALSTIGTAGGYTVATGFIPRLERALLDYASVLGVAETMRTDSGIELPWPISDDTANEGVLLGQNVESTELDPTFSAAIFRSYKISSKLVRVPFELLRDSGLTDFAGELGSILGERIGRKLGRELTNGVADGTTCQGVVPGSSLGKTAASATAISMDDIIDLVGSVDVAYQRAGQCGFMMSQLIAASVRKLKDGNGRYLWEDATQLGQPPRLLGFPVSLNNFMATSIASGAKTILFGDFSKYKVRLVGEVRLKRLTERYAEYDQEGFLAFASFDARLLQSAAVKHLVH